MKSGTAGARRARAARLGTLALTGAVLRAVLAGAPARAEETYRTTDACPTIEARGRWVLDAREGSSRRPGTKGLQTSGLDWDAAAGVLWSVGDQSSVAGRERFGRLYRIDPGAGDGESVPLTVVPFENETHVDADLIRFLGHGGGARFDFEGISLLPATEPTAGREFLLISESSGPAVLRVRWDEGGRGARLLDWRPLDTGLQPFHGDRNRRLEGVAPDPPGGLLWVVYEQAVEGAGYLLAYPWPLPAAETERWTGAPRALEAVRRRRVHDDAWGDPAGLNGLAVDRRGDAVTLWAVQSFAGRLLRLDGEAHPTGCWKLDLRDPEGRSYAYTSPEGIAVDPKAGKLWIITDPAASRYRPESGAKRIQGNYTNLVPMLYEIPIPAAAKPEGKLPSAAVP